MADDLMQQPTRFDGLSLLAVQVREELACADYMTASALAYSLGAPLRDVSAALHRLLSLEMVAVVGSNWRAT